MATTTKKAAVPRKPRAASDGEDLLREAFEKMLRYVGSSAQYMRKQMLRQWTAENIDMLTASEEKKYKPVLL